MKYFQQGLFMTDTTSCGQIPIYFGSMRSFRSSLPSVNTVVGEFVAAFAYAVTILPDSEYEY